MHYALHYSIQYTVYIYITHYALHYSIQYTFTLRITLRITHYALRITHYITLQYTVYIYITHYTLCITLPYTVYIYITHYALRITHYSRLQLRLNIADCLHAIRNLQTHLNFTLCMLKRNPQSSNATVHYRIQYTFTLRIRHYTFRITHYTLRITLQYTVYIYVYIATINCEVNLLTSWSSLKNREWYRTTNTKIKSDALTSELTFPPTGL